MKKTFIYILLLVLAMSCSEKEIVTKDETTAEFKVANSGELIDALNSAIAAANDSKIETIVLDLNELETLYLTGTGQSAAISTQIQQLTNRVQSNDKTLLTLLPKIIMGDGSKLYAEFYRSTVLGNQKANKSARDMQGVSKSSQDGVGGDGALLSVEGNVHISGGWLVSTPINLENPLGLIDASPENGVRITGDRLDLNTSGPDKGAGAVLRVIKFDTIAPIIDGYKRRWLAENIFDNLEEGSETVITTGEHVEYIDMSDKYMKRVHWSVSTFPNAETPDSLRARGTKPLRVTSWKSNRIGMGGRWDNGKYTPSKDSWALKAGESHFTYSGPKYRYNFTPETPGAKIVINVPTYGDGMTSDSAFFRNPETGVMHAWVSVEELVEFVIMRAGAVNTSNTVVFSGPVAVKLPYMMYEGEMAENPPSQIYKNILDGQPWVPSLLPWLENHGLNTSNLYKQGVLGLDVKSR